MIKVAISGTGLFVPSQTITNDELVESFNAYVAKFNAEHASEIASGELEPLQPSNSAFIESASGIKQRYVMEKEGILNPDRLHPYFKERPNSELSMMAEIAVDAGRKAMEDAGLVAADIDAVICSASNMQRAYPAMAIEIQEALGIEGFGYDMNVACSSATFGIEQAVNAVRSGTARAVLMVNPEITSGHQAWLDRDCHFIFGDVCTAVIVQRLEDAKPGSWEVLGTKLATKFSNNIRNNFGFLNRSEDADRDGRDKLFMQEGRKVFKEVCPMAAEHMSTHLQSLGLSSATDVRRYWLHQANLAMNQLIAKKLLGSSEFTADKAPVILDEFANTASAGSVIAFHRHKDDLGSGDVGVICSFGAGYSIGSVVVRKT
ncbi:MAG: beta-ketoacyl-ACP synthase III [Limnobacter sp.]|jgi:beta-ketodecanoyl-[acyl-carrier-protein] synthase|uniref:Beta-ketoacyl-ACP synthase III n=1 Tax=Limnobacter profundi TaxID=2732163 RepID=A0ABX6N3Q0_9BURK|nr:MULTISPECIES: beta-ketoacyl-ACP synthase III [unclassified Limnobacter]MAG82274.1 beta-ketoacyl-ACP synthase III [Sutterellaceae bacterium]MBA4313773.1 beta-ketoacyl-ACP synthase III [Alcaligenaceae bacterium]PZO16263.1 MAG: beta-ketoacyl-ACP synthase III [Betaproteobacteria bacterium]MBT83355.1 beta-ketoacyl-ACP synthase III [Sutterellaceae bacterium]MDP3272834.1 beta-ketoacyl-ACP synthase III [Limnobacter sp.]|tara:strand:- start:172 stop:1296 length:1125 start_codon:yes stop_codon:yes gene_type:complete